jgi:hypothetical protein
MSPVPTEGEFPARRCVIEDFREKNLKIKRERFFYFCEKRRKENAKV